MALLERAPLTYEDYLSIPNDGRRHEIVAGEHVVSPAPSPDHQWVCSELAFALRAWLGAARRQSLLVAPVDVLLDSTTVVQPDLLWIHPDRLGLVTQEGVEGAPDLVVEVVSPTSRRYDLRVKRDLYERFGCREYWVVDLEERLVSVWQLEGERFGVSQVLSATRGDVLRSILLPGFELRVADLFA